MPRWCSGAATTAAEAETRIAFIPQIEGIPYYVAMRQGAEKAAAEFGVTYVQEGPASTNAADQLRIGPLVDLEERCDATSLLQTGPYVARLERLERVQAHPHHAGRELLLECGPGIHLGKGAVEEVATFYGRLLSLHYRGVDRQQAHGKDEGGRDR